MDAPALIALSRQMVLQRRMNVIANNLANLNTTGFKAETPVIIEKPVTVDSNYKNSTPLGMVLDQGLIRDTRVGELTLTGNPLDVALQSDGYFVVNDGTANRYTRGGSFQINADGTLIDRNGYPVQGDGGPVSIPPDATTIKISSDGAISTEQGVIGKLGVVKFANEQSLKAVGGGLYESSDAPTPADDIKVQQGALENSNVQSINQMTDMVEVLRQYQSTQGLIEKENDRQAQAISRIARLN